jgi:hypothetical protein
MATCPTDLSAAQRELFAPTRGTKLASLIFLCVATGAIWLPALAAAQPHPEQPCRIEGGEQPAGALTDKLQECKGVLKPPRVGDADMAVEPPDRANSEMPIIEPGEIPDQS